MVRLLAQVPETIGDWRHIADVLRENGLKFAGHLLAAAAIVLVGRWVALWIARIRGPWSFDRKWSRQQPRSFLTSSTRS